MDLPRSWHNRSISYCDPCLWGFPHDQYVFSDLSLYMYFSELQLLFSASTSQICTLWICLFSGVTGDWIAGGPRRWAAPPAPQSFESHSSFLLTMYFHPAFLVLFPALVLSFYLSDRARNRGIFTHALYIDLIFTMLEMQPCTCWANALLLKSIPSPSLTSNVHNQVLAWGTRNLNVNI